MQWYERGVNFGHVDVAYSAPDKNCETCFLTKTKLALVSSICRVIPVVCFGPEHAEATSDGQSQHVYREPAGLLLSKYTRYQGIKHQSKHFRDHRPPQIKLQHQMKCHQLQTGTLIQYAGSSNARLGGGSLGQFILIRQSRQASCVA